MRNLSTTTRRELNLLAPNESLHFLLEIRNTLLAEPLRFVVDNAEVLHQGRVFQPIGATLTLPIDTADQIPVASLTLENIGSALSALCEDTKGFLNSIVELRMVSRVRPNDVEFNIEFDVTGVTITQQTIAVQLSFSSIIDRVMTPIQYRQAVAPGLF